MNIIATPPEVAPITYIINFVEPIISPFHQFSSIQLLLMVCYTIAGGIMLFNINEAIDRNSGYGDNKKDINPIKFLLIHIILGPIGWIWWIIWFCCRFISYIYSLILKIDLDKLANWYQE